MFKKVTGVSNMAQRLAIPLACINRLTVDWHGCHCSWGGDRIEDHAANPVDADGRSSGLQRWVHGVGGARDGQPVGDAVRLDDAADN